MRIRPASVLLVSAASLAFEILWLRLFAIAEYHHFAYMAVAVALLGIGASGTALALLAERIRGREAPVYATSAIALPISLLAGPVVVGLLPFEPTQIVFDRSQWLVVGAVVLALAAPFFLAGACVALALQHEPERSSALYGASLLGSGLGAVGTLAILVLLPPQHAPAIAALAAVAGAALALGRDADRAAVAGVSLLAVVAGVAVMRPPWEIPITAFKGLPQARAYPGAVERARAWDPTGWVAAVEAPAFRYAPGLSLAFRGALPPQVGLFLDGELVGAVSRWEGEPEELEFVRWLPSAAAYAMGRREQVLAVAAGGGVEILSALAHGAPKITAVELSPGVVRLADEVVDRLSAPYGRPGVRAVVGDARLYLDRSGETFDLIQFGPSGTFAGAASLHALDVDYLNTVEAYGAALSRLRPHGVLAITRWLRLPPRDDVRVIATVAAALRSLGYEDVGSRLAVLRSWGSVVVLVKPDRFTDADAAALRAFAETRLFDLDWLAGHDLSGVPRFNVLEPRVQARAARAVSEGGEVAESFFREYPFHVRPATDARPFFSHFLRARQALWLLRRPPAEWAPYAEWGYLAVLATLAQSVLLAAAFLLVPAWVVRRRAASGGARVEVAARAPAPAFGARSWSVFYFGGLGLGYLFVEMAFIQRLQLWLGHPVYAVAATLSAFLLFSGVGSLWYQRRVLPRAWWAAGVVAVMLLVYAWIFRDPGGLTAALPTGVLAAIAGIAVFPLATVMGIPFPAGLRQIEGPAAIAWAWAVNGFASVVAAPLATLLSLEAGMFTVLLGGAVSYGVASLALARHERS